MFVNGHVSHLTSANQLMLAVVKAWHLYEDHWRK